MRRLLAAALLLGLAACAGTPKKTAPAAAAHAQVVGSGRAASTPACDGGSPYAPAQEDPRTRGDYVAGGLYKPGVADSTPAYVPDVACIREPEVVALPRSKAGNRSRYTVLGKTYHVLDNADGFVETGLASYYGEKFHGRRTSNLEVYDMYAFTAAHKSLPLPSFARVTNLENGHSVVVRVNDRGPFHAGRVIDLSYAAAVKLDFIRQGTARVEVRALTPGDAGPIHAAAPAAAPAIDPRPAPAATGVAATVQTQTALAATADEGAITLQLAAFSALANAERALARVRAAGIDGARLLATRADGRPVWRLRIGPLAAAAVPELAVRIVGLGFDPPQRVHD